MKIRDIPQSGKIGTMVSYKHGSVLCRRKLVVPQDPRTEAQVARRNAMARAARLWATLSAEQYIAWSNAASGLRTHPSLNQSGALPPRQLFCRINCNLAAIDQAMVLDPPPRPSFDPNPVDQFTITDTDGVVALKLHVLDPNAPPVIIRAAKPQSAGTTYVDHFTILGMPPAPMLGLSDITALYVRQWGVPPAGSRVFIEIIQQINGWQQLPLRLMAQVPNP